MKGENNFLPVASQSRQKWGNSVNHSSVTWFESYLEDDSETHGVRLDTSGPQAGLWTRQVQVPNCWQAGSRAESEMRVLKLSADVDRYVCTMKNLVYCHTCQKALLLPHLWLQQCLIMSQLPLQHRQTIQMSQQCSNQFSHRVSWHSHWATAPWPKQWLLITNRLWSLTITAFAFPSLSLHECLCCDLSAFWV